MIEIDKYIDKINNIPLNTFEQIYSKKDNNAVVFKFDTPLFGETLSYKYNRKFNLFELGGIISLNVMFAYVFTFPFRSFDIKQGYFIIRRPSSKNLVNFSGVELSYQSNYINIYNSEEGDCLISANRLNRVILNEIVRKSKKNK